MSLFQLLLRNLLYHWRGNVPVMLGVLVGGTVLTGALLVGDSLRGSLRDQTLRRLGWVDQAMVVPRLFRNVLADEVEKEAGGRVSPALLLQGTAGGGEGADRRFVRGVTVLGVKSSFFAPGKPPFAFGTADHAGHPHAWISQALAQSLDLKIGDKLILRLQKPGALPREGVLANKRVDIDEWELTIAAVLAGDEPGNLFNLRPELEAPRNVLVALPALQERLGVPGQVNALLAAADLEKLNAALRDNLSLEDWGLTLHTPATRASAFFDRIYDKRRKLGKGKLPFPSVVAREFRNPVKPARQDIDQFFIRRHPYLALESKQLLLAPAIVQAAQKAAEQAKLVSAPTLVYLCKIDAGGKRIAGVVAAVNPELPAPLGPFLPPDKKTLSPDGIVLARENASDEKPLNVGDKVILTFKPPVSHGQAPDRTHTFRFAGYIPLTGVAADPYLTPEFPGITDKDDAGDWELPFDDPGWQQQVIRKEYTDSYWDKYRATPRAYIRLADGQALWSSRFGELTSIRLAPEGELTSDALEAAAKRFITLLRKQLQPASGGFVFDPVKATALQASQGGTPFGLLFLCFSFFLILSALLLVGLLFRLNLDRRASEIGVLFAEGYRRATVRWLLLGEGGLLALAGTMLGGVAALVYSRLLVDLLTALWPGGTLKSLLTPHATPLSLVIGATGALAVSLLTIAWVVRVLGKVPPRALLAGQTTSESELGQPASPSRWRIWVAIASAVLGLTLLAVGPLVPGQEAKAGTFFTSGMLFLTVGLLSFLAWMRRSRFATVEGHGAGSVARLGVRNASRHPMRSLLTVGLLASAAFLIVAVESFRRTAEAGNGQITAPDGGFALLAESDLPIVRDLNSEVGRDELLDRLAFRLQNEQGLAAAEADKQVQSARELLQATKIVAFRVHAGDDASCLNLFQPRTPRVLGVPEELIERGGFVFDSTLNPTTEEKTNPWLILKRSTEDVPAFGEANTVTYMLDKSQGQSINVPDEKGVKVPLQISGLLHDSVFQSSLLVSEERFLKLYPTQEGYNFFLIAPPRGREDEVKRVLERALADRGFEVTRSKDRLEAYLAVENTYLSTFQALGALGLVLGSLGLAVVLLRAVWERRSELALLRALGYRRRMLAWLVLAENGFLLLVGLAVGAVSALLSILPQLLTGAGAVPWRNLALLFVGVLAVALLAGAAAVAGTLRAPIVPALRRE